MTISDDKQRLGMNHRLFQPQPNLRRADSYFWAQKSVRQQILESYHFAYLKF